MTDYTIEEIEAARIWVQEELARRLQTAAEDDDVSDQIVWMHVIGMLIELAERKR